MDSLFFESYRVVEQVQSNLGHLEKANDESEAQRTMQYIAEQLRAVESNCQQLEFRVGKELPARRRAAKCKLDQLKLESQSLNAAATKIHSRLISRWRANAEREELFTRRIRPNESTHLTVEDGELLLHDRLHSSNNAIDELLSHGSAVLDQIRTQGFNLRGVKRRVLDISQQLGLSSTTLRMIQRRFSEDKVIFIVGCIIVLLFMYVFYRYWKGYRMI